LHIVFRGPTLRGFLQNDQIKEFEQADSYVKYYMKIVENLSRLLLIRKEIFWSRCIALLNSKMVIQWNVVRQTCS